ncbi:hypothetical protein Vadar_034146 [Vaccinium darrowii]|uniref:Uncharacterized protein n=1 Tax=Vaccinium darrowii TaxID=229202 RepID=A0ACB7YHY3_9ERIC|nr:hypothetical protein Vadar_034146 [Vaccinium darrowii]
MDCSSLVPLLLVLLLIGVPSQSSFAKETSVDLVNKICPQTYDSDLCLKIFRSDPRLATADARGLGQIIVEACLASAKQVVNNLGSLINSTMTSPRKDVFETCLKNYNAVLSSLETAKNLLLSPKKYIFAVNFTDIATANILSCDTTFFVSPEPDIPAKLDKVILKTEGIA